MAIAMLLLMGSMSLATDNAGLSPSVPASPIWGTPVLADGNIDNLWDEVSASSIGGNLEKETTDMTSLVDKGKSVAKTITAVLTLVCFIAFLVCIAKLATSAGNPQKRSIALTGILVSGIALALFGGSWVVVSFFWNILAG